MSDITKVVGAGVLSLILLAAGFYVLLHGRHTADLQKAATGWIGLVAGYWLK